MTNLQKKYIEEIAPKLKEELNLTNIHQIPNISKIVVNAGIGKEYKTHTGVVEEMVESIALITGQKPVVTNARESISNFKLREGMPNGVKVTLRKDLMWNFLDRLINVALPRIKDFRGVPRTSFDGRGNYTLGIREHTIFPEIDTTKSLKIRSMQVVIETTSKDNLGAEKLLTMLGVPFKKSNVKKVDNK